VDGSRRSICRAELIGSSLTPGSSRKMTKWMRAKGVREAGHETERIARPILPMRLELDARLPTKAKVAEPAEQSQARRADRTPSLSIPERTQGSTERSDFDRVTRSRSDPAVHARADHATSPNEPS
jgi:hypothetical protein